MSYNMGLGGLGKPGARESTQVNIQTQITIPALRFFGIWSALTGALFAAYIVGKSLLWSRGDWSLLIGIAVVALTVVQIMRLVQNPLVRFGGKLVNMQYVFDAVIHNWILAALALMLIILSLLLFVVNIVPVMTLILDQQWYYVLLFCAAIALVFSARSFIQHHRRNLENSLFDSSENVYMHTQDNTLNIIKYLDERGELSRFDDVSGRVIASRPMPINGRRIVDMLHEQDRMSRRAAEEAEQITPPPEPISIGITGKTARNKAGNAVVPYATARAFLWEISEHGTRTTARSQWEHNLTQYNMTMAQYDAMVNVLDEVGLIGDNKRLVLPYISACETLGIPLPDDAPDAGQSENRTAVPSRPASQASRPVQPHTGNDAGDSAVMALPGVDH